MDVHKYAIGTKVYLLGREGNVVSHAGTVMGSPQYQIEFVNPHSGKVYAMESDLSLEDPNQRSPWEPTDQWGRKMSSKCECGIDILGFGLHSDYCPKYGKEDL